MTRRTTIDLTVEDEQIIEQLRHMLSSVLGQMTLIGIIRFALRYTLDEWQNYQKSTFVINK